MDRLGIFYNNLKYIITHEKCGESVHVARFFDHPFLSWNPITHYLFTDIELRRLHRHFRHPKAEKLHTLLIRSEMPNVSGDMRKILERITREYSLYHRYATARGQFKFTLRDEKELSHTVFVDIFHIGKNPILHIVNESTRYQTTRWLKNVTADAIWRGLRMRFIDVYQGPWLL